MIAMVDDMMKFATEDEIDEVSPQNLKSWKILIVDDEVEIHNITRLALGDFIFDNKKLQFLSAYSGVDARQIMTEHPDVAVTLLDVIMESDDAGLITAKYIRERLQNRAIRIILRTGQPGQVPERQAIIDYDIDDYKTKTEFTSQKLFTTIITALRSYKAYSELASINKELEKRVEERTIKLLEEIEKRKEANRNLEALVNLDGLTQVANRRCFDAKLKEEWNRLAREQRSLALILFDLDSFKNYNDCYGHLAGDDCLIKVAQAVQKTVDRAGDLVARYGGEEFVILLPNTNSEGAILVAVRVQSAIAVLRIPHEQSGVKPVVTVSLGITALVPTMEVQPETLVAQADQALYKAKQQGRDQYFTYSTLCSNPNQ